VAAGLSWLVAVHLFGHRAPLFAPVAAIVSIDMTLGQRLRRAIELIVGASVGVGVGALLISAIGTGPWQIAIVVALAGSVAVLLDGRAVINVQAAVSAILVATIERDRPTVRWAHWNRDRPRDRCCVHAELGVWPRRCRHGTGARGAASQRGQKERARP